MRTLVQQDCNRGSRWKALRKIVLCLSKSIAAWAPSLNARDRNLSRPGQARSPRERLCTPASGRIVAGWARHERVVAERDPVFRRSGGDLRELGAQTEQIGERRFVAQHAMPAPCVLLRRHGPAPQHGARERVEKTRLERNAHVHDRLLHLDAAKQPHPGRLYLELCAVELTQEIDRRGEALLVPSKDEQPVSRRVQRELVALANALACLG